MVWADLVRSLSVLDVDLLAPILKTIRNITMSPNGLEVLQNANVIDALVRVLTVHLDGPASTVRKRCGVGHGKY
jgi:hypothetical protein